MSEEEATKEEPETPQQSVCMSASGLSNPAAEAFPKDFCFNVNGKKYYCFSLYADFLSPKVARLHEEDPKLDHFDIDLQDNDNTFELVLNLMYGEEIQPTPMKTTFFHKLGVILENEEITNAFKITQNDSLLPRDAVVLLASGAIEQDQRSFVIDAIAQGLYLLTYEEMKNLVLQDFIDIFNNPNLCIFNEESFFQIICDIISDKGEEYNCLLSAVGFHNLSNESMKKFVAMVKPSDLTQELWSALTQRMSLKVKERRIHERYIHTEIPLPYTTNPFGGLFTYLRKVASGKNPVDAKLVDIISGDTECSVLPKNLLEYGAKSRWYLAEREDNTLTFDFKNGKFAMSGYTITSGASSSYWEYATSWTWEGSNDNIAWEEIDVKTQNQDLGQNETTHTWTCTLSPLFRYVRFRLRDVVRHGGLYCREFELFGAYQEPPE